MPPQILNIYRVLHTWTGIVTGMFLFIAFYAGAIILFEERVTHWATPPAVEAASTPLEHAPTLIRKTLEDAPASARSFWLHLDETGQPSGHLAWEVLPEGSGEHDELAAQHFRATLDEAGEVHIEEEAHAKVAAFINVLHMVVGLPVDNDLSRLFMGAVALLYFVSLVSGVVYLIPRILRDLFALRIDDKLRRMWRDAHVVVGLASLPFHLIIALTAAGFAFHDPIYGVQNFAVHDGQLGTVFRGPPPEDPVVRDLDAMLPPEALVEKTRTLAPELDIYALQYAGLTTPNPSVRVWGHDPRGFEFRVPGGFALLDPFTGEVKNTAYLPGHQAPSEVVLSGLFATHFATYGGPLVKGLYFVLALAGAWLFYTGNLHWLEVRRKRLRRGAEGPAEQTRSSRALASLTVGVTLGAVAGISVILVAAKALPALGLPADDWLATTYYSVFFVAVGWAFLRGGARASVELLALATLATLAIPLISLAGLALPSLGLWTHTDTLAIDAVALGVALGLGLLAHRTAARVYRGPVDSVWYAGATST